MRTGRPPKLTPRHITILRAAAEPNGLSDADMAGLFKILEVDYCLDSRRRIREDLGIKLKRKKYSMENRNGN